MAKNYRSDLCRTVENQQAPPRLLIRAKVLNNQVLALAEISFPVNHCSSLASFVC